MTAARYTQRTDDPHPVLADIARFLLATGMSDAAFGTRALSDPNFVEDVRCGRDFAAQLNAECGDTWPGSATRRNLI